MTTTTNLVTTQKLKSLESSERWEMILHLVPVITNMKMLMVSFVNETPLGRLRINQEDKRQ